MGLRYRDLVVDLFAQAPPKPCGCTGTYNAPQCPKASQNPNQAPNRPKPDGTRPPKKAEGLEQLRYQLRAELRASG